MNSIINVVSRYTGKALRKIGIPFLKYTNAPERLPSKISHI
jgi:hypothetical protein